VAAVAWAVGIRRGRALPGALALALALGGARYVLAQPAVGPGDLAAFHGQEVVIAGYVAAEPDVRGTYTRLEIARPQGNTWWWRRCRR
jgi:hypothetical protein